MFDTMLLSIRTIWSDSTNMIIFKTIRSAFLNLII